MTDHKFTDEEIRKALECCASYDCTGCPLYSPTINCVIVLPEKALELVDRQRAEIERLKDVKFQYEILQKNYDEIEQQLHYLSNVEIPYLYSFTEDKDKKLETLANILLGARAKAIKEFAERLKEAYRAKIGGAFTQKRFEIIDDIVKEMTEEQNESQNT